MKYILITIIAIILNCLLLTPYIKEPAPEDKEETHQTTQTTEQQYQDNQSIEDITVDCLISVPEINKHDGVYEYYYTQLQSNQHQTTYREIYNLIKNQNTSITIEITSNQTVADIIKLFRLIQMDHPELYYTQEIKYITHPTNNTVTIYPVYTFSSSEKIQADKELKEYTEKFNTALSSNLTKPYIDTEIEEFIYQYITTNTEYNLTSPNNQNLYSVVQGESVCLGYSKMFKYLCDKNNIPCMVVRGKTKEQPNKTDESGHAWNKVYIANQWYITDLTTEKNMLQEFNTATQNYKLNITDELHSKQYEEENISTNHIKITLPECNSIEKDWYNTKGVYITDFSEIENKIKEAQTNNQKELTIRTNSDETYQTVVENINNIAKQTKSSQTSLIKCESLRLIRIVWR